MIPFDRRKITLIKGGIASGKTTCLTHVMANAPPSTAVFTSEFANTRETMRRVQMLGRDPSNMRFYLAFQIDIYSEIERSQPSFVVFDEVHALSRMQVGDELIARQWLTRVLRLCRRDGIGAALSMQTSRGADDRPLWVERYCDFVWKVGNRVARCVSDPRYPEYPLVPIPFEGTPPEESLDEINDAWPYYARTLWERLLSA